MVSMYDVLKASKGLPVDDIFAELWGRKLSGDYTIVTYTGTLPVTLTGTKAGYLHRYKIYGNTVQASTPTPSTPVAVEGVGEEADSLFDINTVVLGKYIDANGVERTSMASSAINKLNHTDYINILPNTDYTFTYSSTAIPTINTVALCWYDSQKQLISRTTKNVSGKNYYINGTSPSTAVYCIVNFIGYYETSVYQFNESGTTPPYYKIPITCGGQTTNIYLGSASTTRRVKKLVLTGTENFGLQSINQYGIANFYLTIANLLRAELVCTHFPMQTTGISTTTTEGVYTAVGASYPFYIRIYSTTASNKAELQAWLAQQYANGTPVTIWYITNERQTSVVNEPLMKIGSYADTIDSTQTTAQIPTTAGSTTISWAGEGIAPSKVEFEYERRR